VALIDITNSSNEWLVMWLEPLGEDRWLRRGETLRVKSDYVGAELAISIEHWARDEDRAAGIAHVSVWVEGGSAYAEVTHRSGRSVPCGSQRPEAIDRAWKAGLAEAHARLRKD
jgi:hypothetical protein